MRFGAELERISDAPAVAVVDAHFGPGEVVGTRCMALAVEKAGQTGIGCVAVRGDFDGLRLQPAGARPRHDRHRDEQRQARRRPLGRAGSAPLHQPDQRRVPGGERFPIVIDMATSAFSMGDAIRTARDGGRLSFAGIVDRDGNRGDDPARIVVDVEERESKLDGALLPLGPKGFGMA